jgi:hypothetical protein
MSSFTRFGFGLVIALYGIYQIANDHPTTGLIALGVAAFLVWLGGKL